MKIIFDLVKIMLCCALGLLLLIVMALLYVGYANYSYYEQLGAARSELCDALNDGEVARVQSAAGRLYRMKLRDTSQRLAVEEKLELAYEMNGDYDAAQAVCGMNDKGLLLPRARLAFKRGEWQTAFESYCEYVNRDLLFWNNVDHNSLTWKDLGGIGSLRHKNLVKTRITLEQEPLKMRWSPFFEFSDFMIFMEMEYAALGSPEEYKSAMEFFRSIADAEEPLGYSVLEEKPRKGRGFVDWSRIAGEQNEVRAFEYIKSNEGFIKGLIQSRLDLRHELKPREDSPRRDVEP